jgi:hypothetical protein
MHHRTAGAQAIARVQCLIGDDMRFALASLWVAAALHAAAAFANGPLVIPGPETGVNSVPFVYGSGRYQFLYGSALFPPGPNLLTAMAFSPVADGTLSGWIQIRLGTTEIAVDQLTSDLASNAGDGIVQVFEDTTFVQAFTGGSEGFSLSIPFETPFVYDPADGNLLVDFAMDSLSGGLFFVSYAGATDDLASRAGSSSELGDFVDSNAIRIRLTIPEAPASVAGAASAVTLALLVRRRG